MEMKVSFYFSSIFSRFCRLFLEQPATEVSVSECVGTEGDDMGRGRGPIFFELAGWVVVYCPSSPRSLLQVRLLWRALSFHLPLVLQRRSGLERTASSRTTPSSTCTLVPPPEPTNHIGVEVLAPNKLLAKAHSRLETGNDVYDVLLHQVRHHRGYRGRYLSS